jgi:hypothetical protein
MDEVKVINVEHEIMGLQYYIEAMAKHETSKNRLEDLGNLMIHVNNLKAWAGLTDSEQECNCNKPAVSKCAGDERRNLLIAYGEWIHGLAGESNNELATRLADKYLESN